MKINVVAITALLISGLAAGAIFHGLYVRLFSSHTEQEYSNRVTRDLPRPADNHPDKTAGQVNPEEKVRKDIENLIQQVSIMSRTMNTFQEQINVLFARINTEGAGVEEKKEPIDSSIAKESSQDQSSAEPPGTRYNNEIRDDQWASPAEAAIAAEFTTNPDVAGVTLDTIDCRTSLCRLTWQHKADMTNEEAFILENEMLAAMNRAGFNASSQVAIGGGSTEGIFWYKPPPPQEFGPGRAKPPAPSEGAR